MAKIEIAAPCHRIHRFLLPPHAAHVLHVPFDGGALVLGKILVRLLFDESEVTHASVEMEKILQDWMSLNRGSEDAVLPERFITLAPFAPPPVLKKHLKPGTQFLRVNEKEDGEGFNRKVQVAFRLESHKIVRPVLVVGGVKPTEAWECLKDYTPEAPVVYILAECSESLLRHCKHVRVMLQKPKWPLVGQIELADLAKDNPLQMETSYERIIGDICRTKNQDGSDFLASLVGEGLLDHLIIRVGNAACLVVSKSTVEENFPFRLQLCCHPQRCAPTAFPGLGSMLAYDLLLSSAIVRTIALSDPSADLQSILSIGAMVAVQATYRCFCEGFGLFDEKEHSFGKANHPAKVPADDLFARYVRHGLDVQGVGKLGKSVIKYFPGMEPAPEPPAKPAKPIEVHYPAAVSPNQFWRMVVPGPSGANNKDCEKVAERYLKRDGDLFLPIVEIGKNKLVDRHEVEDYLFLQRLLRDYHADGNRKTPLSIAVFGQPGGGKSFGVKQLVQEMSDGSQIFSKEEITINLSQLLSLDELCHDFHRVRDACLRGPIPLVFIDEFDASLGGQAFGWLKYFLAPMQDGAFVQAGKTYHFGKAIFVFAGGINHTFSEFNERTRSHEFCDAKGPDFISRLRGILNIKGMDMPDGDRIEHIYMIRRAVFLRDQLEARLGKSTYPLIDSRMIAAFLRIPRFKHGVRSMEAILQMSALEPGKPFSPCHLPPRSQLDMHVDAREFLTLAGMQVPLHKG